MPSSTACIEVMVKQTQYASSIANGYVVLAFILCFLLSAICVIIFVKYVLKFMALEKEREKQSLHRRETRRIQAAKIMAAESGSDCSSYESIPLETNYLSLGNKAVMNNGSDLERSHSGIKLIIEDTYQPADILSLENCVLETLATLFTSGKNSLAPTKIHHCFCFMQFCFDLFVSFHREAFSMLLHLMLDILFEERRINEIEKLQLLAKYEQIFDEPTKAGDMKGYTNKLHFVLATLKNELADKVSNPEESHTKIFAGERFCKYLMVIQREILIHDCKETVREMFVTTEYGLVKGIMEKWFFLEVARYRVNLIYDAVEAMLVEKTNSSELRHKLLNGYIAEVYQKLHSFCIDYEKETNETLYQLRKDKDGNSKQALMELETSRFTQRSVSLQHVNLSKMKTISKFIVSQIDTILNDFQTFTKYKVVVESESLELFSDFQNSNEKKVTKLLKQCEQDLFEALQTEGLVNEEALVELGKKMSSSLKDLKIAQEKVKVDVLENLSNNIINLSMTAKHIYHSLEKKFVKGVKEIKKECLEVLHSLSNLTEADMNKLEHEFDLAFSSFTFSLQFVTMLGVISNVQNKMSAILDDSENKDLSFSLHDMVNILKQDKSIIKTSSLFKPLDPAFYVTMENELCNTLEAMTVFADEHLETIKQNIDQFLLPKINSLHEDSFLFQSDNYVAITCLVKENLLASSTNSKGYTSKKSTSFARNYFEKVESIWESQADFKAHKLKEEKKEALKDFAPIFENFFILNTEAQHFEPSYGQLHRCQQQEFDFFKGLENLLRSNSIVRVLDCNLENELMVGKFEEKLESFETKPDDEVNQRSTQRTARSAKSKLIKDNIKMPQRKELLRHSISKRKTHRE